MTENVPVAPATTPEQAKASAAQIIRDLDTTSGYWAAVWTICCLPDAHVICDAPIGCFNLVGTAVPDYTDAIPHIENLTPSVMREQEVTMLGTAGAVRRAVDGLRAIHPDRQMIVVSTAESEMISSDHGDWLGKLDPPVSFYWSRSLEDDEWVGRDRVLLWLWKNFGQGGVKDQPVLSRAVNIIGPTYGCFNSPADLHEIKRLIAGAGGVVNLVYPYEAALKDTPRLSESAVNVVLHREYGDGLAQELGKPFLHAPVGIRETTDFIRELGKLLGAGDQAEAFIEREKKTTLQPIWDLWRGPQGDWFSTTEFAVVAGRTYADGLVKFLGDELGMKLVFATGHPIKPGEMDNIAVRNFLHKRQPGFVFGSINEKIYLAEAGARATHFIPAGFPIPIVRRALGTPFMGYSGAVYIAQEMVNRFYETVFNYLPIDTVKPAGGGTGGPPGPAAADTGTLIWSDAARAALEARVEGIPWLSRISAMRDARTQVEAYALRQHINQVTPEVVQRAIA